MNDKYTQILVAFVTGEMNIDKFKAIYDSMPDLQQFLQDYLPTCHNSVVRYRLNVPGKYDGNINKFLQKQAWKTFSGQNQIHGNLTRWLIENNVIVTPTNKYSEAFKFSLDVMPDYIDGDQAGALISKIIESVSETMPKGKRIKEIKEKN